MNLWLKVQNSGLKEISLCCCLFLEVLNLPLYPEWRLSGFVDGESCPVVSCWAPTSSYAGPEFRDQAGGQGRRHTFEWPTTIHMPGEKILMKPLRF